MTLSEHQWGGMKCALKLLMDDALNTLPNESMSSLYQLSHLLSASFRFAPSAAPYNKRTKK